MKKEKFFLVNYGLLIYLELIFGILMYDNYSRSSIFNVLLYLLPVSLLITIITSIFKNKVNKVLLIITYSILGFWFSLEFVFMKVFKYSFSLSLFKLSDQVLDFGSETLLSILRCFYGIILFFVPLILIIVFRKKMELNSNKLKDYLILIGCLCLSVLLFYGNLVYQKNDKYEAYELYYKINDNALNMKKLGVLDATMLDLYRSLFGFEEKISIVDNIQENDDEVFEYDYNNLDIDFSKLESKNSNINIINEYLDNDNGTKKNKYTGIFEGMNLIYITAESFHEIGVDKDLTPTLYKLVNSGFKFNNFYTSHSLSTIGGEFQSLTGLYANSSILTTWRSGKNTFPYGLATMFKNENYNTYAYHNHYYNFQDRNVYLKSMGFDNYKGCYNGIEKIMNCGWWPNSDVEMIDKTINEYINSDEPFLTYYMTVSGHFQYNRTDNYIVSKNWKYVKDLNYSDEIKSYLATQIELDKALELLINKLEEVGKLDNTVIVLLSDHYPYAIDVNKINEISSYTRDSEVEINHNNLIIWNNKMKNVEIDKVSMSIDVIPTVYNLFGLDYDSRLFVGKDILSSEGGLAIMDDRSWVTKNGTYFTAKGNFISKNGDMTSEYIDRLNNIVSNRINISKLIISTDYYKYLSDKQA